MQNCWDINITKIRDFWILSIKKSRIEVVLVKYNIMQDCWDISIVKTRDFWILSIKKLETWSSSTIIECNYFRAYILVKEISEISNSKIIAKLFVELFRL